MDSEVAPDGQEKGSMALRKWLMALVTLGFMASFFDILLYSHWRSPVMIVPIVFAPLASAVSVAAWIRPSTRSIATFRATSVISVMVGIAGAYFHIRANAVFSGGDGIMGVIRDSLGGYAPALAPLAFIDLGIMGLLSVYRMVPAGPDKARLRHTRAFCDSVFSVETRPRER